MRKSKANLIFQVSPDYIWFLWTFARKYFNMERRLKLKVGEVKLLLRHLYRYNSVSILNQPLL